MTLDFVYILALASLPVSAAYSGDVSWTVCAATL
jgi:hypothetical protein